MGPVDVRQLHFTSADGTRLEGELLRPGNPRGHAVVCHPHPLYGGSRHDAVVGAITRALVGTGLAVLRFDFRGAGGSEGAHGGGGPERDDARAAIDALDPGPGPLIIAGYSFGADIALSVDHPAATRWIVAAPPLRVIDPATMVAATDPRPVDIAAAEHDRFNPPDALRATVADWIATTVHVVPGTDHFFSGAHRAVTDLVSRIVDPAA